MDEAELAQVQEVREAMADGLAGLGNFREAAEVQAVDFVLEAQEVQGHDHHLPPDRAALAHQGRHRTARRRHPKVLGRGPGRGECQKH